MKVCKKCGAKIRDELKFCEDCGTPIIDKKLISKEQKKKRVKIAVLVAIIAGIAIICALTLPNYFRKNREKRNEDKIQNCFEENYSSIFALDNIEIIKIDNKKYVYDIYIHSVIDGKITFSEKCDAITQNWEAFCGELSKNKIYIGYIVLDDRYNLQVNSPSEYYPYYCIYDNDCHGIYSDCFYTQGKEYSDDVEDIKHYDTTINYHQYGHLVYERYRNETKGKYNYSSNK